ncbi:MAG TPA: type II toxin-antitoxin system RelE/ParE family toxin [Sphingomonas sp.]
MARVDWPEHVLVQIDTIIAYVRQDDPAAANRLALRLIAVGDSLSDFPHRGRPAAGNTRELASVAPYVLRYRVQGDFVTIRGIRHGARRRLD